MDKIFILLSLILTSQTVFSKTYRQLFTEGDSTITQALGKDCTDKIKEYLNNGKDFKIPALNHYLIKISDYNYNSLISDRIFYHYTTSPNVFYNTQNNRPDLQFDFLRNNLADHSWYLAEDPLSSRTYGNTMVKVILNPDKFILPYSSMESVVEVGKLISTIIKDKTRKNCEASSQTPFQENFLYLFILEENDVALIDYYNSRSWFQLISEDAIEKIEIGQHSRW